jgi:hypothetical protein
MADRRLAAIGRGVTPLLRQSRSDLGTVILNKQRMDAQRRQFEEGQLERNLNIRIKEGVLAAQEAEQKDLNREMDITALLGANEQFSKLSPAGQAAYIDRATKFGIVSKEGMSSKAKIRKFNEIAKMDIGVNKDILQIEINEAIKNRNEAQEAYQKALKDTGDHSDPKVQKAKQVSDNWTARVFDLSKGMADLINYAQEQEMAKLRSRLRTQETVAKAEQKKVSTKQERIDNLDKTIVDLGKAKTRYQATGGLDALELFFAEKTEAGRNILKAAKSGDTTEVLKEIDKQIARKTAERDKLLNIGAAKKKGPHIRFAPRKNQNLPKRLAQNYREKAGGDIAEAKRMAREDGWTFQD